MQDAQSAGASGRAAEMGFVRAATTTIAAVGRRLKAHRLAIKPLLERARRKHLLVGIVDVDDAPPDRQSG